jgi:glycosyltransferase involved in cell wall biosynthesis
MRRMMGQPFISFIIPARNEEKMIGACLDAIGQLACEPGLWECILVDNGSTDATAEIGRAKGARVLVVPNATISALRNLGAKEARGEFLGFIDADCVIDKDWLKNALASFCDAKIACVGCQPGIPEQRSWVQETWALQNRRTAPVEDVGWLPSMNILVRKSAFAEVGGFNETLTTCEDVDFCYRLKKNKYRIVSDLSVKSVHYGEAKTIPDFFRKERWRGQSNLQGLLSHGFYWREIPSVVLPLFYLIIFTSLSVALIYVLKGSYLPLVVNLCLVLLPPLVMSMRTSLKVGCRIHFAPLTFLYLVYFLARAAAIISVTVPEWGKAIPSLGGGRKL